MGAVISQATYPPFIFSLIIGVPSMILYMIEIFVLIVHSSNFRSAFFRLFIARFIVIWKYLLPLSILVTYLAPLTCTVPILTYEYGVRLQNDNVTFTLFITPRQDRTYIQSSYVAAVSGLLFGIICGLLNIITILLYRKSRNAQEYMSAAKLAQQKVESRLTIYAIITFIAQLSMAAYYILIYVASWLFQSEFNFFLSIANQLCWLHDICVIAIPSWFLLWASSKVKEHVFSTFLPSSWIKPDVTLFTPSHHTSGHT
ncbi:serpentine type 7TM GPCR chemoreceptor srv domain-containing protein [Ditylenchus destructor]|uniref:Serpentine type 7TM GPCR chemoreceptor srv domain-containing protein n=1 Tax=Ditylenchus destructor TaxID=166010 RepID=A0AAD4MSI8_9BILA|nr:serpentine type 7TM GPCR chemoreceptor srv domain-containing protein [Ditylenchus destructor]